MACSISGVKEKSDGPEVKGAKTGSWAADGAEVAGVEETGANVVVWSDSMKCYWSMLLTENKFHDSAIAFACDVP